MILYGLKTCDTCRKALKSLLEVEFRDVRIDGVPQDLLKSAYAQFGNAVLNTRSTTWRGLDAVERERDPLDLLAEHPALMKRPLIDHDGVLFLGWTKDVQEKLLG
ncbi:arsenate reductase family protein [Roseovarius sp. EL26]|uniref:arsenate reductase family protein n=1 Tax=Roseovarius sp. EL26 TaxID=2126672 RepID=UPI000EA168F2|nr:ArsC/Spx/MgsR family protein [Roseovarius sp. EL26]